MKPTRVNELPVSGCKMGVRPDEANSLIESNEYFATVRSLTSWVIVRFGKESVLTFRLLTEFLYNVERGSLKRSIVLVRVSGCRRG